MSWLGKLTSLGENNCHTLFAPVLEVAGACVSVLLFSAFLVFFQTFRSKSHEKPSKTGPESMVVSTMAMMMVLNCCVEIPGRRFPRPPGTGCGAPPDMLPQETIGIAELLVNLHARAVLQGTWFSRHIVTFSIKTDKSNKEVNGTFFTYNNTNHKLE